VEMGKKARADEAAEVKAKDSAEVALQAGSGSEKKVPKEDLAMGRGMVAWQMQVAAAQEAAQRTCSWRLGRRPLAWTERRFVCFPCRMRSCQGWSGWSTAAQH